MSKKIDLTGQRFGRLVVVKDSGERSNGGILWECKCECGNKTMVRADRLKYGKTKSCGCLFKEVIKNNDKNIRNRSTNGFKKFVEEDSKEGTRLSVLKRGKPITNTSGHKGVSWDKENKKWRSYIQFKGKTIMLGSYDNIKYAIQARKEAEEKYFQPILEKYGKEFK